MQKSKHKLKLILALFISILPLNILRVISYRIFFNYTIENSKIGWLSIININNLNMKNSTIRGLNLFTGPFDVQMVDNSLIGSFNYFKCGQWANTFPRKRGLNLSTNSSISNQHFFDLFGLITIEKDSRIAGVRSQFWTHGSMSEEVDIGIGKECYIGSGVKFTPGAYIASKTLCAMGSLVTKKFSESNILIAGVPAKKIKENINWRENWK